MMYEVRDAGRMGHGVFATQRILSGRQVLKFTGELCEERVGPPVAYLQVGARLFIASDGGPSDYVNHSCAPNCRVLVRPGGEAFLLATTTIHEGQQLFFDYSLTSTDTVEEWHMRCLCNADYGPYRCRGIISGYKYLPAYLRRRHETLGAVPAYVEGEEG